MMAQFIFSDRGEVDDRRIAGVTVVGFVGQPTRLRSDGGGGGGVGGAGLSPLIDSFPPSRNGEGGDSGSLIAAASSSSVVLVVVKVLLLLLLTPSSSCWMNKKITIEGHKQLTDRHHFLLPFGVSSGETVSHP